ncbi:MAG: ABC transporter ATP-binding protein [Elusimicrobia bacterium]|nr:ABC transporter ATP-binding protein [Elusimicrobiota bacterium]MDE2236472.1 ABC transporter ATP-binding protein [Elusimicrobiota bacterium]MDE2425909.1 ABC transporter ATP-binding protein [Elusimicrobiota bacterium]
MSEAAKDEAPILELRGLAKHFPVRKGFFARRAFVRAVDGVCLSVRPRESFAVVGESGCGKTTLAKLILALEKPTAGQILFEGRDLHALPRRQLRRLRRDLQVIFQDPFSSLDPRMTVEQIVTEPWTIHGLHRDPAERRRRLSRLLDCCGISASHLSRYPHEFSGGQRQRVGIARALALEPKLVVADEPVSALDVSIQAQILNLLKDLQRELGLTYVFISHDFSVVRHLCDRIAVMYLGRIVELADSETLFNDPQHPYTEALLSAVPVPDPAIEKRRRRIILSGDVPSPLNPPSGCRFHPRCRYAVAACKTQDPALKAAKPAHLAACPVRPFSETPSAAALTEIPA